MATAIETQWVDTAPSRAEQFAEKMTNVLSDACLALMASVGHRTGLFETMAKLEPATPSQIAQAAGLHERYVREWLGAMVLGGIVEHDPQGETYILPAEHAACLTKQAGPDNIATMMQYIPLLGSVEDGIVDCFRHGGGLPYSAYPRFHAIQAEDSGQILDATLLDRVLPTFPEVQERLRQGVDVLDVGCGTGRALTILARAYPSSRFVGYDFSEEAITMARAHAEAQGLTNVTFEVRDVAGLDTAGRFDLVIAFDAIHDQAKPRQVLGNIARALRADGRFLMIDIRASSHLHENHDHPLGVVWFTVSCMHCMTVSLSAGGEGLGAMWGEQKAREYLTQAGFGQVDVRQIDGDVQNLYFLAQRA